MVRESFRLHSQAAGKHRRRVRVPKSTPVVTMVFPDEVIEAADGDMRRVEVRYYCDEHKFEVIVHNSPDWRKAQRS